MQRERLIGAMAEVERLRSAADVQITAIDPEHADAVFCLERYARELVDAFNDEPYADRWLQKTLTAASR